MDEPATISTIARVRGWLLIIIGASLSVGIGLIAAFLASTITHYGRPGGTHWTGDHEMTLKVFELFTALFVFGLVSIAGGMFQLKRGRASWLAMLVLLALVGVVYFLGQDVMRLGR